MNPLCRIFDLPRCVLEDYIVGTLPCDDVVRFWAAHPRFQTPGFWERQYALRHKGSAAYATALGVAPSVWSLGSGDRDEFGKEALFVMGKRRKLMVHEANRSVYGVACSPDGRTIASASGGTIKLWDVATGALKAGPIKPTIDALLPPMNDGVMALAFSADGSKLIATGWDAGITMWNAATYTELRLPRGLEAFALSPDGRTVVARSRDHTALLLDAATGMPRATLAGHHLSPEYGFFTPARVEAVFSPDGRTLATSSPTTLWDVATGAYRATLVDAYAHRLVFSPDSRTIATMVGNGGNDVVLWAADTGALKVALRGHASRMICTAFSPDGCTVATADGVSAVVLWDAETGAPTATLHGSESAEFVVFSPDGRTLATSEEGDADAEAAVKLWDASSGALRATLSGMGEVVFKMTFSPDGRTLTVGSFDGCVHHWANVW